MHDNKKAVWGLADLDGKNRTVGTIVTDIVRSRRKRQISVKYLLSLEPVAMIAIFSKYVIKITLANEFTIEVFIHSLFL